jgi:hypothetical protein
MLQWADIVEVSREEAKQDILDLLDSLHFAATAWQEGSVALACVEVGAEVWSQASKYAYFLKTYVLNATSSGDGLTRFSDSHYDNQRVKTTNAQRTIIMFCAVDEGPHVIGLSDLVIQDPTGHTFRNVEGLSVVYPVTLSPGGTLTLLFEAEVGGSASNVGAGTVTTLATTLAGVTIYSDVPYRAGIDAESDTRLQVRNKTKWATLSQFELISDAVENIALNAAPGIIKVVGDFANPRGAGSFDVYIAAAAAVSGSGDVTAAQAAFNARVFGATTCVVYAAAATALTVSGTIYYDSRFTALQAQTAVEAALLTFIEATPIGGWNFAPGPTNVVAKNDVEAAIKGAASNGQPIVRTLTLSLPASDLTIPSHNVLTPGSYAGITYVPVVAT